MGESVETKTLLNMNVIEDVSRKPVIDAPLEENWEEVVDDTSGASYFYNHATGESSWERPVAFVRAVNMFKGIVKETGTVENKTSVPEGWEIAYDDNGTAYYYNLSSGET